MANSKGIKSLKLVGKPGGIVKPGITKYGVWDWVDTAIEYGKKGYEWYKDNKDVVDTIGKTVGSLGKGYLDYKDAKRRNELEEQAYDDYMEAAEAAGQEARAAIDLNLTPMTVTNIPTTKADITDYTAATGLKHGGISGLRKKYARGPEEAEVLEMDEEVITPYDLQKEEGVEIGEQVFYNTGRGDRANAMMIWEQMSTPDKSIFEFDFEIFFNDGGWRDMIKGEAPGVEGNMKMASHEGNDAFLENRYQELLEMNLSPAEAAAQAEKELSSGDVPGPMATGGVANLRNGGRPGYMFGELVQDLYKKTNNKESKPFRDTAFLTGEGTWGIDRAKRIWLTLPDDIQGQYGNDFMNFFESTDWHGINMKKGGIAGLRKKYAIGTDEIEIEEMDEELITPFDLKQEEGVSIGPMAGPDWYIKRIEHLEFLGYDYEEASDIAFDDDKYYSIVGMESAIPRGGDPEQPPIYLPKPGEEPMKMAAKGGRIKKANGGIMDLGGLEKDYRFSGGFVPIGEYEKKDDVPARLSKNEFVFTADAVRAAGGGSINKGAKRMYNVMKNLEAKPEAKRMIA
jgi:hypothetical protein